MLKSHGMSPAAVQTVFQAAIVSKLTYAAPAWIGFTARDETGSIGLLPQKERSVFVRPSRSKVVL